MGKNVAKMTYIYKEDLQMEDVRGPLMDDGHPALDPQDYRPFHEKIYQIHEIKLHEMGPPHRIKLSDEQANVLNEWIKLELIPRTYYLSHWWAADYDSNAADELDF
ncbi:hypothetical protein FQN51_006791 [Onygenales sp. PD_10]|nr:hypothetical protein FQN51_006791 [Onygenales sp. PD_10]